MEEPSGASSIVEKVGVESPNTVGGADLMASSIGNVCSYRINELVGGADFYSEVRYGIRYRIRGGIAFIIVLEVVSEVVKGKTVIEF